MKLLRFWLSLGFILVLNVSVALSNPLGANQVDVEETSRFNDNFSPASVQAQAGNVSELSINATVVTRTWQGFYGNITGNLLLADSAGNNFYNWNVSTPSGQVYASRGNSISWNNVDCINSTRIVEENNYLGRNAADPDSIDNTFVDTNHPSFFIGVSEITTCPTTQTYGSGETQNNEFWQVLLDDTSQNETIYTTLLEESLVNGFNDRAWDFQLLVGENGQPGNEASTAYYFYVELN